MKSICVFCGSNAGASPIYGKMAQELGKIMARRGVTLVYGGGSVGLMGMLADSVLAHNGKVIGVIPNFLWEKEVGHRRLTQMIFTESMHERKQRMADLSDGFITLPGGIGTMEEFFEIFTWGQLGLHRKPFGILNVDNYYDHLLQFFGHMVEDGFLKMDNFKMLFSEQKPKLLLNKMQHYQVPQIGEKWLNSAQT